MVLVCVQVQVTPALEAEECVCAVSFLWWCQQLAAEDKLWQVVANSSKALKDEKAKKSGLAFWHRVQKACYSPPYTVSFMPLTVCLACMLANAVAQGVENIC